MPSSPVSCVVCTYKKGELVHRRHHLEVVQQQITYSVEIDCLVLQILQLRFNALT